MWKKKWVPYPCLFQDPRKNVLNSTVLGCFGCLTQTQWPLQLARRPSDVTTRLLWKTTHFFFTTRSSRQTTHKHRKIPPALQLPRSPHRTTAHAHPVEPRDTEVFPKTQRYHFASSESSGCPIEGGHRMDRDSNSYHGWFGLKPEL